MAATTLSPTRTLAPAGPMLIAQTRAEVYKRLRSPMSLFATIALPVVLFALLGLGRKSDIEAGVNGGRCTLASFAAYGVSGVMFMTYGLGVSVERAQKINVLMRATPVKLWVLLTAKIFSALVQAAISMLALFAFAIVIGRVHMPATMALSLFARVVFSSMPLLAAGFALGYTRSPSAAQLHAEFPSCKFVILTTFGRPGFLRRAMGGGAVGYLVKDAPAAEFATAIRRVAAGECVIGPALATAALSEGPNPLTDREREVLADSAQGARVADIAGRRFLSESAVRNYLHVAIQNLGAHNRVEAARIAAAKGWLSSRAIPIRPLPSSLLRRELFGPETWVTGVRRHG